MRRALLAFALAAMVALAGCHQDVLPETATPAPGGSTDATSTATTTPSPTHAASLADRSYPDGANESGFTNVSKLIGAGGRILNHTSFTIRHEVVRTGPDGSTVRTRQVGRETTERGTTVIESTQPFVGNYSIWAGEGPGVVVRQSRDDGVTYTRHAPGNFVYGIYANFNVFLYFSPVTELLTAFEYEAVDAYGRDGHEYVVYESTGVNESFASRDLTPDYAAANLTVTVRDDGVVTGIEGTVETALENGTRRTDIEFAVEDVGDTTVAKPPWVDENVPRVEATTVANGTVIEVTHRGGPALEHANVSVGTGLVGVLEGTVEEFGPGDTIYLYATGGEFAENLTVTRRRPTPGPNATNVTDLPAASVADSEVVVVILETGRVTVNAVAYRNESA